MAKKVSIIVPVFNEEETIDKVINRLLKIHSKDFDKEIIIVNDGSIDNTKRILSVFEKEKEIKLIEHKKNLGKGAAVRTGIKKATGDVIIIQDGDLEYNPKEIINCIRPILLGKEKVVYGSRFLDKKQRSKIMREGKILFFIGNQILTFLTNILFKTKISDEATCYKAFDVNIFKAIKIDSNGFEWEPEITAKILKLGLSIKEIPISYCPRKKGKKIKYKDGLKAALTLIKYKFFYP